MECPDSGYGTDLAEVVLEAVVGGGTGIGHANGICRMVEHVQGIHPEPDGFRFGDSERLARTIVELLERNRRPTE